MWLFRIFLFALMAIVLWRMVRTLMRLLGGGGRARSAEDILRDMPSSTPSFDKMEEADFEDVTPPKTPQDAPPKNNAE